MFRNIFLAVALVAVLWTSVGASWGGGGGMSQRNKNNFIPRVTPPTTTTQPTLTSTPPCNCPNAQSGDSGEEEQQDAEESNAAPANIPTCHGCKKTLLNSGRLSDEEMQQLRIEEIKLQILKKLRMKNKPHVKIPRNMVPLPIMRWEFPYKSHENFDRNVEDYYAKTEQVIIVAENKQPSCPTFYHDPAGCFSFKLTNDAMDKEITSAELWVFKLRDDRDQYNQTYYVSEFVKANYVVGKRTHTVAIRDTSLKDGWLKFDITTTVRRWIEKSEGNSTTHTLEVSCKTCAMDLDKIPVSNDPGEQPFIVINLGQKEDPSRQKRSVMCDRNSQECCKESLYINFTDINWGDWILQPDGYYANYCKGSCLTDITSGTHKYATVMQKYVLKNRSTLSSSDLANLTPCCTSIRTSSLSIIYLEPGGILRQSSIPNMIVDACGCN